MEIEGDRPNPDELLAKVKRDEDRQHHGKLKIFFGAAAGVGKTYTMLKDALRQKESGVDVVVGVAETHGRVETQRLLEGLEVLPRVVAHPGSRSIGEFDLLGALSRKPRLLLVDELAHTNAPGSRHRKRWQDVRELLDAGIDVHSTLNVQHLDSLNDVVAKITGVVVREVVPDSILDQADEVELIDLPPDELLERFREGKVYAPERAAVGLENFFSKGNLLALRELALRRVADRVDAQMLDYRRGTGALPPWPTTDRILVCIGPSPYSAELIRVTARMAARQRAPWIAAFVETPGAAVLDEDARARLLEAFRLAERLGGDTATIPGERVGDAIARFARERNVTRVVLGRPEPSRWRRLIEGSIVDEIMARSEEFDVHVIGGERRAVTHRPRSSDVRTKVPWTELAAVTLLISIITFAGTHMTMYLEPLNIAMLFLLAVVIVALRASRATLLYACFLSVAAFDFFCVPPFYTFAVSDTEYIISFGVMLVVALVIGNLTYRVRKQAWQASARELRTRALFQLTRDLAASENRDAIAVALAGAASQSFGCDACVLLSDGGPFRAITPRETDPRPGAAEFPTITWAMDHGAEAGFGTDTLPSSAWYFRGVGERGTAAAVLGLRTRGRAVLRTMEDRNLLNSFVTQTAVAMARIGLAREAQEATLRMETERTRNSLLRSISHDLRTPLSSISGAASTLLEQDAKLDGTTRHALLQSIFEESQYLARVIANLFSMTQVESEQLTLRDDWHSLGELVDSARRRIGPLLEGRTLQIDLPESLPMVRVDGLLLEQVLMNLMENAARYSPPGSPITIEAVGGEEGVRLSVQDQGPGFSEEDLASLFQKFQRGSAARLPSIQGRGAGLGLALCKAVIDLHGGAMRAENVAQGGARVGFLLPLERCMADSVVRALLREQETETDTTIPSSSHQKEG